MTLTCNLTNQYPHTVITITLVQEVTVSLKKSNRQMSYPLKYVGLDQQFFPFTVLCSGCAITLGFISCHVTTSLNSTSLYQLLLFTAFTNISHLTVVQNVSDKCGLLLHNQTCVIIYIYMYYIYVVLTYLYAYSSLLSLSICFAKSVYDYDNLVM